MSSIVMLKYDGTATAVPGQMTYKGHVYCTQIFSIKR